MFLFFEIIEFLLKNTIFRKFHFLGKLCNFQKGDLRDFYRASDEDSKSKI